MSGEGSSTAEDLYFNVQNSEDWKVIKNSQELIKAVAT